MQQHFCSFILVLTALPYLEGVAELQGNVEAEGVEASQRGNAVSRQTGVQLSKRRLQVGVPLIM